MLKPLGRRSPRPASGILGSALLSSSAPLDFSKPNEHDSKAEFLEEQRAVEACLEHVQSAVNVLIPNQDDSDDDPKRLMLDRLRPIIDSKYLAQTNELEVTDALSMVRKNVGQTGAFTSILLILLDFWIVLGERKQELKNQEDKFWNVKHRAPDYYARAIALRLAKLYAREAGKRPTLGTSPISGEPSTTFGRALQEIFAILEITATVRPYAKWAVEQLTEDDLAEGPTLGDVLAPRVTKIYSDDLRAFLEGMRGKGPES